VEKKSTQFGVVTKAGYRSSGKVCGGVVSLTELCRSPRINSRKGALMLLEEAESSAHEEYPEPAPAPSGQNRILQYALLAIAAIYVIASLYLLYDLRTRLTAMEQKQKAMEQAMETAQAELNNRIHATSSEFKQALTTEVGMTKQEMAKRAAELDRQQKAAAAKLTAEQNQQGQQIAAVNTEVSGVKTEVGAAKTDIQKTQTDLAATN